MNELKRYEGHMKIPEIGYVGQQKLRDSSVVIIGCGGLGCASASILARAGVGRIILVDNDRVALENLHRQILYDEYDAKLSLKKVIAAEEKLHAANSEIAVISRNEQMTPKNIISICKDVDIVVDGTDNMEARFLINDVCAKLGIPWVYGAVSTTEGMTMTVVPFTTPCFRCFITQPPGNHIHEVENPGVLSTVVFVIASLQATQTLKILTGAPLQREVLHVDVWYNTWTHIAVERKPECPVCGRGKFEFLEK